MVFYVHRNRKITAKVRGNGKVRGTKKKENTQFCRMKRDNEKKTGGNCEGERDRTIEI